MEYVYAALLLHKAGKEINEGNVKKILTATGIDIDENRVRALVAALKDVDIEKAVKEAVVSAAVKEVSTEKKKEEKKEEEKPSAEAAAAGLSALFG